MNTAFMQKTGRHIPNCGRQIVGMLKVLGVSENILYSHICRQNASFWMRPINHLEVLEQARKLYRSHIVSVHPDRPGGNLEKTIRLNRAYDEICRRFKEHGFELGN